MFQLLSGKYILGSDSWTLCNIVPRVMGHYNPTEKYRENATQIE